MRGQALKIFPYDSTTLPALLTAVSYAQNKSYLVNFIAQATDKCFIELAAAYDACSVEMRMSSRKREWKFPFMATSIDFCLLFNYFPF